jgi:hypothetical protein
MTVADAPMRTTTDAWRSLKRYVAYGLGDAWEVRLWDEVGEFVYPFARIEKTTAPVYVMPAPNWTNVAQTFSIHAYAEPQAGTDEAILAAAHVEDLLYSVFYNVPVPHKVPIFDYKNVALDQAASARFVHDWMHVDTFSTEQLVSPEDERLRWVLASVRLSWSRPARLTPLWNIVQNVRLEQAGR